ncbi:hypothetical protein BC835DRAFT_1371361 [Cytidiella melzeri]|nr:hypothetical protein BC835DRAFT_1371361 [Cytidiella melzeri]
MLCYKTGPAHFIDCKGQPRRTRCASAERVPPHVKSQGATPRISLSEKRLLSLSLRLTTVVTYLLPGRKQRHATPSRRAPLVPHRAEPLRRRLSDQAQCVDESIVRRHPTRFIPERTFYHRDPPFVKCHNGSVSSDLEVSDRRVLYRKDASRRELIIVARRRLPVRSDRLMAKRRGPQNGCTRLVLVPTSATPGDRDALSHMVCTSWYPPET